jgi:hypothetical protein
VLQIGLTLTLLGPLAGPSKAADIGIAVVGNTEIAAPRACPGGLDSLATCFGGKDRHGAYYLIAQPKTPNGILIVHAHGGPRHVDPAPDGSDEDLVRYAMMVREGYAWIGTTYRVGGYGVRLAVADTDIAREIYWNRFGRPRKTIVHGQSYGGNVAAKLGELAALDEKGVPLYDGIMLTGAAVGKRLETYDGLITARVVYQFFCKNLPYPHEPQYPAWQGLPKASTMPRTEARRRVNQCTGIDLSPAARTPEQARNLSAILGATGFEEAELAHRLELTTFRLQDVVHNFLGGQNPFTNIQTVYSGSGQDDALNRGVERFSGTINARDKISYDSDVSGTLIVPTISLQARFDPVVSFRAQAHYRKVADSAGQSHLLFQLLTSENMHSGLAESQYLTTLASLVEWSDTHQKPTLASVRRKCADYAATTKTPCLFIENDAE